MNDLDFSFIENICYKYGQQVHIHEDRLRNGEILNKVYKWIGFNLLNLELITGISDINDLHQMMIDGRYLELTENVENNDLGIDAYFIDDENKKIQLFNFKHRENAKPNQGFKLEEMYSANKFLQLLQQDEIDKEFRNSPKLRITIGAIDEIKNILKSSSGQWAINLFLISNDGKLTESTNPEVRIFKDTYGLSDVKIINLAKIVSSVIREPVGVEAKFSVGKSDLMLFKEFEESSNTSYLFKIRLADLVRITSNNSEYRNNYSGFNYENLNQLEIEETLLYDNVRGYLGEDTKYNKKIISSIRNNPQKFFMFNNGITMTAEDVEANPYNGNLQFEVTIKNFQVVNGGQTLNSSYRFANNEIDYNKLLESSVLMRVFKTSSNRELTNHIAEYTNSQNAISIKDLKSVDPFQVKLEKHLEANGISYVRKAGRNLLAAQQFDYRISKETLAQVIYSQLGFPEKAANQIQSLLENNYSEIFDIDNDWDYYLNTINLYREIIEFYRFSEFEDLKQKYFYVIYLLSVDDSLTISSAATILENALDNFENGEGLPQKRKLYRTALKSAVDAKLSEYLENSSIPEIDTQKSQITAVNENTDIDDVLILAANTAYGVYLASGIYVCMPERPFREVKQIGFYADKEIKPELPYVKQIFDFVSWTKDNAESLQKSTNDNERELGKAIEWALSDEGISISRGWGEENYKVFLLEKPDVLSIGDSSLNNSIPNNLSGRGSAFTQKQRYVPKNKLFEAESTNDLINSN